MKSLENFKFRNVIIGTIAGIVSGLFSTGGGMILVPAFIYLLKIDDTKARGTSVFCILPMVLAEAVSFFPKKLLKFFTKKDNGNEVIESGE